VGKQNFEMNSPPGYLIIAPSACLTHVNLTTGHVAKVSLASLNPLKYLSFLPLLRAGYGRVADMPAFNVSVSMMTEDCAQLLVAKAGREILAGAVVWGVRPEESAWAWLVSLFEMQAEAMKPWQQAAPPAIPVTRPWLGVVLRPGTVPLSPEQESLRRSFEGLLALAVLRYALSRN
jgi:hypothetical protein